MHCSKIIIRSISFKIFLQGVCEILMPRNVRHSKVVKHCRIPFYDFYFSLILIYIEENLCHIEGIGYHLMEDTVTIEINLPTFPYRLANLLEGILDKINSCKGGWNRRYLISRRRALGIFYRVATCRIVWIGRTIIPIFISRSPLLI